MSLERIEITPFTAVVADVLATRATGSLSVITRHHRKTIYWAQGDIVLASSTDPAESLAAFLLKRQLAAPHEAALLSPADPTEIVTVFFEKSSVPPGEKQSLLREWITALVIPLFSLDEGTVAFMPESGLDPEKRMFLPSTAAVVLEGIRSINNGLVIRRSLGDMKRLIEPAKNARFTVENLPITPVEAAIAGALSAAEPIEGFLRRFHGADSLLAAKMVISMLTLGVFAIVEPRAAAGPPPTDDPLRDLALLAAIGSEDPASLRAVAVAKRLPTLDYYQLLELPRAAARGQIATRIEQLKGQYNPAKFPPVVREYVTAIQKKLDEALAVLGNAVRRAEYDKVLQRGPDHRDDLSIQQRVMRRSIAEQNYKRAEELSVLGDYYPAIVLLKQAVDYAPDHADAWFLLGSCQAKNPKWRREAMHSLQKAITANPSFVDAMISLGDLYKSHGLAARAQACYEDVLNIEPDNPQAKSRLKDLK